MESITKNLFVMKLDDGIPEIEQFGIRMGRLPQELYNEIFEDVFTARTGVRNLTKNKRDSHYYLDFKLLHVSRASRALYASTYYGNKSTFQFDTALYNSTSFQHDTTRLHSWLKMLPELHRALLYEVISSRMKLSHDWVETYEQVAARDLWKKRYHISQGEAAIKEAVFVRSWDKGEEYGEWKSSQGYPSWANQVFLKGIQYMFDPGELWE